MAASSSFSLLPFLYLSFLLFSFTLSSAKQPTTTITIPISPSIQSQFSESNDRSQILNHLASLSLSRARHLKTPKTNLSSSLITTPLFPRSYGGYSVSLSFGTPPQTVKFVMDTGSSLVWFPCTARYLCSDCNFPNIEPSKIPTFMPKLSSSSRLVGCRSPKCALVFGPAASARCQECAGGAQNCSQACPYAVQYGLGSTAGLLLLETLVFPERTVPDFIVGCSIISTRQPEGIAGFGRSPESLPSQMGLKRFSHCLVSRGFDDSPISSDLILDTGSGSGKKTEGLNYTKFLNNPNTSNAVFQEYYYVALRKIVVGDRQVKVPYRFSVPDSGGNGGTIVDSGTTFTFMEKPIFDLVAKEFETQMANFTVAADVEKLTGLRPCFNVSGEGETVNLPGLEFQFKGGAKMALPPNNYFAIVDSSVICLTIVSDNVVGPGVSGGPAIILGNFQQQNFLVEYDLENNRFGFKEQSCV